MTGSRIRSWIFYILSSVVLISIPAVALAAVDIDLRTGYYFDAEDAFVGGGVLMDVGESGHWYFNPNLEYVFVSDGDLFTVNGDVHYDFDTTGDFFFWLGAGPAVIFSDFDPGGSETDLGANVFAGAALKRKGVRPFAQLKVIIADESDVVLGFGVRF